MPIGNCEISLVVLASAQPIDLELFREMLRVYRGELDGTARSYEVIVVDDGIGGEFLDAGVDLCGDWPQMRLLQFRRSFGESVALSAAVKQSRGRYVITSTWYLQVDPAGLTRALELLDSGVDYVAARRDPRCDGRLARAQSWLFNAYTRWITKVNLHDLNCSFRAFKREVVEEISFHGDMFRFISILAWCQGFKVREIPLPHLREEGGPSLLVPGTYLRRFLDILSLLFLMKFTKKPLRFFGIVGFLFLLLGSGISIYMGYLRLVLNQPLADKPMLVLGIFLMVLGIIIGSIGLIGEILIFTHGREFRDFHIARVVRGGHRLAAVCREDALRDQGVQVHELNQTTESWYRRYVDHHPQGTLFHDLLWRSILDRTFKHKPHYLLAMRSQKVVGILPLYAIHSIFLGRSMVSVPFGVYGGILADDDDAARALVEEGRRLAYDDRMEYVELRHRHMPPGVENLPRTDIYHTFIRDLPENPEEVLAMFPRKARAEVRKARRHEGLEVAVNGMDLSTFHHLFAVNKRRLGSPPFPKSLFENIVSVLGDRVVFLSIAVDGDPVAAVMSFVYRETIMAYYSGATSKANSVSANNLLYAALMEEAVRRGLKQFDFGRSRKDTGSFAFKKNQGFEPQPLYYQYLLRRGCPLPSQNNSNPRYEVARRVFRALPVFAAEKVGSFVTKRLPV